MNSLSMTLLEVTSALSTESKPKKVIHLNPLSATFLEVSIDNHLDYAKQLFVRFRQHHYTILHFGILLLRLGLVLGFFNVP